ncbi:MAG: hypothetical protein JO012_22695, partial [Hyphomicrobiales bacterium]|nr:hypothetical protein [Hyphomicrobiales bacterium]
MDRAALTHLVAAARSGGDWAEAVAACRQAEAERPGDAGIKRLLFVALMA